MTLTCKPKQEKRTPRQGRSLNTSCDYPEIGWGDLSMFCSKKHRIWVATARTTATLRTAAVGISKVLQVTWHKTFKHCQWYVVYYDCLYLHGKDSLLVCFRCRWFELGPVFQWSNDGSEKAHLYEVVSICLVSKSSHFNLSGLLLAGCNQTIHPVSVSLGCS